MTWVCSGGWAGPQGLARRSHAAPGCAATGTQRRSESGAPATGHFPAPAKFLHLPSSGHGSQGRVRWRGPRGSHTPGTREEGLAAPSLPCQVTQLDLPPPHTANSRSWAHGATRRRDVKTWPPTVPERGGAWAVMQEGGPLLLSLTKSQRNLVFRY